MFATLALSVCIFGAVSAQFRPGTFEQNVNTYQQNPRHVQTDEISIHHNACGPEQLRSDVDIPREYTSAHQRFSSDLLKHQGYWDSIEREGVAFTNSFTLGHLLTLLSQEQFDLPTTNIPKVLRLPSKEKAVESYSQQFDMYEEEDNKVLATSYLFTPFDNVKVTPAVEHLFTRKQLLNLFKNPHAPSLINELVHVATHGHIDNDLLPIVPPFTEQTVGVYVNTFHYASDWKYVLKKVGKQNFYTPVGTVSAEAYEANGVFSVLDTATYTAVALPLEGETKHVVFVQPKDTLKEYFTNGYIDEIFTNGPHTWPKKNVRVQVPYVNVTLAHGFHQLDNEKIQCVSEQVPKPHHIQPIVQVVHFAITHEEVEYSVSNGVQVNQGAYKPLNFRHLQQPNRPSVNTNNFRNVPRVNNNQPSNNQHQTYTTAELIFDRPFFTYMHDHVLGPFAFNAIAANFHGEDHQHVERQARHHDLPPSQIFDEPKKVERWNCEQ